MKTFRAALTLLVIFTVLTGLLYPLAVYAVSGAFTAQRRGSLVTSKGTVIGSKLIGQQFTNPGHFWGRPSVTSPQPYNGQNSGGSNLGPTNGALTDAIQARVQVLHDADPENTTPVPIDLVTASASGLDPHVSPEAAYYQVHRVAKARNLDEAKVKALVEGYVEGRDLGLFGEPRVNVLMLNIALDELPMAQ